MSESSRVQDLTWRHVSGHRPADVDLAPRIVASVPPREPDLALLPRIASQLALLNLMSGRSPKTRRAQTTRSRSLVRPTTGPHSLRRYR